jgi:hypothetical protein
VSLQPLAHNWVLLPQTVANTLQGTSTSGLLVLRLKHVINNDREFYVTWNGLPCREAGCIGVPEKLGRALGLQEGDIVRPEVVSGLPVAKHVNASVASADDWDVLECNAEHLTSQLLLQVQVVRKGDTLPIWIRGVTTVNVVIQSAQPQNVVLLKNDTIVSIEPIEKKAGVDSSGAFVNTNNATNNDAEPSKAASTDASTRRERMLADVIRLTPQAPSISGPMRLRVKVWGPLPTSYFLPTVRVCDIAVAPSHECTCILLRFRLQHPLLGCCRREDAVDTLV